jgi:hypothetical protein
MIAGRPVNLWLGLTSAISGAVVATLIALGFDPVVVGTLGGVWQGVLGASVLLIANQPPTLSPGDTFHVQTETGQPNYQTTVATPPAADLPPVPAPDGGKP